MNLSIASDHNCQNEPISFGSVHYTYKDHLGSTRAVVNAGGTVLQATDYYPFGLIMDGRSYLSGSPAKEGFTGKERDDETGFDHFGARTYSSELGRFIQVDPLAEEFPEWSPYNYTMNNPLRYTDPTGMAPIDDYGFDITTGQLSLIRETDDDFDVIYTGEFSDDGSFKKDGESIEISKGTLQGKYFDDISKSGLVFRDLSEGLQSMKFLSYNSHLEFNAWAFKSGTEEGLSVSPWEKSTDRLSRDFYQNAERVGYLGEKLFNIHTHPGTTAGYGGGWKPSGVPGGRTGDIPAAEKNPQYPHYILSRHYGVVRYYPFVRNGGAHQSNTLNKYFKN